MTDNELGILLRAQLLAGLARHGLSSVDVLANYQPTTQGRPGEPTIFFFPVSDNRYGWQHRRDQFLPLEDRTVTEERQWVESSFQVMALSEADPADMMKPTAKDLLNMAAMVIGSANFVQAIRAEGVGVQRVTALRNPYFVNDQGQFEASPSFDFTVTHMRAIIEQARTAESVEVAIHRI